jgi:predicted metal-dependent peptidase
MMNLENQLSGICKRFFMVEPFYGLFLMSIRKEFSEKIPTAAVTINPNNYVIVLLLNPTFWSSLDKDQQYALLKHELLHICLYHLYLLSEGNYEKQRFNIAADIEVNQYVDNNVLKTFSEKPILLENFKQYLPPVPNSEDLKQKGAIWYYNNLNLPQQEFNCSNSECNQGKSNQQGDDPSHSFWEEMKELSDGEKDLIKNKIDSTLIESYNSLPSEHRGILPGSIVDRIKKLLMNKQFFNWKSFLKNFVGGSSEIFTKKSRYKPSKRFEDASSIKVKKRKKVLVAIDTSGSVSREELVEFLSVIHTIHNSGNIIDIIQCDSSIAHKPIQYKKGVEDLVIYGRGGTYFDPPITYLNQHQKDYIALIYFTDGEAPSPEVMPAKSTLWVLSPQTRLNPENLSNFPGKVIKIPQ